MNEEQTCCGPRALEPWEEKILEQRRAKKESRHFGPSTAAQMAKEELTALHRRVLSELWYDPEKGTFESRKTGKTKGYRHRHKDGTCRTLVYFFGWVTSRANLAWFYVHGAFTARVLDHINGDTMDDRIANLREVSCRQNTCNQRIHRTGKLPGCSIKRASKRKPWQAQIRLNGNTLFIGRYATEREAHEAYMQKREELNLK